MKKEKDLIVVKKGGVVVKEKTLLDFPQPPKIK